MRRARNGWFRARIFTTTKRGCPRPASFTWRLSFVIVGAVSGLWVLVWFWYFRDDPKEHPSITAEELHTLAPPRPPMARIEKQNVPWGGPDPPHVAGHAHLFLLWLGLWLYLNWIPPLFKNNYHLNIKHSALFASGVFFADVIGDTLGGLISDGLLRATGDVRLARTGVIVVGFLGAFASLLPIFFIRSIDVRLCHRPHRQLVSALPDDHRHAAGRCRLRLPEASGTLVRRAGDGGSDGENSRG